MMSRLEAERALSRVSQIAAGNGLMQESDQRRYLNDLRRAMNGGRQPKAEPATVASLAQIGIKVTTEGPATTELASGLLVPSSSDAAMASERKGGEVLSLSSLEKPSSILTPN